MKDVDNDLQIIEHDPLTGGKPVSLHGSNALIFFQAGLNFVGDCF